MIADTFIKRPVTAIVVSIVIVLVGLLSLASLPVSQYPDITPPTVQIISNFIGADAQTVEQTVTTPIEVQVNGTPGMAYMQSNSTNNGQSIITVTYEVGSDVNNGILDVQNRVGIASPSLPDELKRLGVITRKRNPSILMLVAIYAPRSSHAVTFLDNYTNIFVRDVLLRVKGVGDVFSRADDFSMRIWLKPDKMAQMGLTTSDVTNALQEQNVQISAGSVGAPPQNSDQAFEYSVIANSRLSTEEEFNNIVVRSNPKDGSIVYLKDVARVQLGKFSYASNSFVDGKRASYLLVYQAPGSNALATAKGVYAAMDALKTSFPPDIDYVVPFESISVVEVSIHEVVQTLLEALGLVVLVVFLFLQSWRATLIPVLAIPVSIIGTFIFFIPLGFTINTLTLFGFVLAIGIVVDDAIVVVEAVQHYIDVDKLSAKEATERAMKDISGPVIAIALILAAVFVPVGFIPGIVGRLYQQFALTIAISVILSAFVALSLTPALCTLLLKPTRITKDAKGVNHLFFRYNSWFERVTNKYANGVRKSIKGSRYIVILLICICAGTWYLFKTKPSGFIPPEDGGRLFVTYQLPEASSTTQSVELMTKLMKVVGSTPGVTHYAAFSGFNILNGGANSNNGTIFCTLKNWDERKRAGEKIPGIINIIKQRVIAAGIKNANVVIIPPAPIPGIGQAAGFSMQIQQGNTSDDIHGFETVVKKFVAEAHKNPAISTAFSYYGAHTPGYNLTVDRDMCEKLGVNISDVFNTMQAYMGSLFVNNFTLYNRTYHVVVQADTAFRALVSNINKYYVRNAAGQMVSLSTLISYKATVAAPLITHFNIFRSAEIGRAS